MFIDKAKLYIKAGKGGDGCLSFHREKYRPLGGPDGGNGGKGGDVIIKGEKNLITLLDLQRHPHYKSKDGEHGWSSNCYGKSSKDLFINVPLGTVVKKNDIIIADITENNQETVVALGGRGGRELKMIADVGILGYPNAGKSTFLSKVTSARPKIADYPFTTLTPNLGVVSFYDRTLIFADIPGLIEGASKGKGLGHDFLRHIERTKILLHMVDAYGYNKKNAYSTYLAINKELKDYSKKLAKKLQIIAVNKIDVPGSEKSLKLFKKKRKTVFPISALKGEGLKPLLAEILKKIDTVKEEEPIEIKTINYKYEPEFSIIRINNYFEVIGKKILDLIAMTNFNEEESIRRFQNILKKIGVDQKLKEEGIKIGDIVKIGDFEFHYEE